MLFRHQSNRQLFTIVVVCFVTTAALATVIILWLVRRRWLIRRKLKDVTSTSSQEVSRDYQVTQLFILLLELIFTKRVVILYRICVVHGWLAKHPTEARICQEYLSHICHEIQSLRDQVHLHGKQI